MSLEDAEEAKRQSLEAEEQLDRMFETKRNRESSHLRRALAARKKDRMHSLMEKQEAEKAQVGPSKFPCMISKTLHNRTS